MSVVAHTPEIHPLQRGRAEIDFVAALSSYGNGILRDRTKARFEEHPDRAQLDEEFDLRLSQVQSIVDQLPEWRFDQLYTRFVAEELHPTQARVGVERHGIREVDQDAAQLVPVDPDLEIPSYYDGVNYHASPYYSEKPRYAFTNVLSVIPTVFNRAGVAAVPKGSNIFDQRKLAVDQARSETAEMILDIGSGGGGAFLNTIARRYPDAEIHGVDLSAGRLCAAAALGKSEDNDFQLSHQNGEEMLYADDTFDLVMSYALLHEVPDAASIRILNEAFRVLKPGGEMVMIDVPPYRAMDDFQFLIYDWETEGRNEPYWRESCRLNRGDVSREAGFVDVEEYGLSESNYPWILRARKPAR